MVLDTMCNVSEAIPGGAQTRHVHVPPPSSQKRGLPKGLDRPRAGRNQLGISVPSSARGWRQSLGHGEWWYKSTFSKSDIKKILLKKIFNKVNSYFSLISF